MDERLDATLETYQSNAAAYATANADRERVTRVAEAFLARLDGERVLDLGCGPGWETATFAADGLDVVGLDPVPALLAEAGRRAPAAGLLRGDARSLPLADAAVDGVWACASLHHLPRDALPDALAEIRRVLAPGGVLAVTVKSDAHEESDDSYDGERHFEYYEVEAFVSRVEAAGLAVETDRHSDDGWILVHARAE